MTPITLAVRRPAGPRRSTVSPRSRCALFAYALPSSTPPRPSSAYASERLTPWNSVPSTSGCLAASTPVARPSVDPVFIAGSSSWIALSGATVPVSGIAVIACWTERGTPGPPPCSIVKPCAWTVKSRANALSIWSLMVPMKLEDIELLTTTTDSPIVRATAVAAVRRGLESSKSDHESPHRRGATQPGVAEHRPDGRDAPGAACGPERPEQRDEYSDERGGDRGAGAHVERSDRDPHAAHQRDQTGRK